jgi:hypothetical protein
MTIALAHPVSITERSIPANLWHPADVPAGVCPGCQSPVAGRSVEFDGGTYHPRCFCCSLCRKPIAPDKCRKQNDLIFHRSCRLICFGEHCAVCSDIVDKGFVQAVGRKFHVSCLSCVQCGKSDFPPESFTAIHSLPYCSACFAEAQQHFPKCSGCGCAVLPSTDHADFFFRGRRYFVHCPRCLKCAFCSREIPLATACIHKEQLCCRECHGHSARRLCAACGDAVMGAACARLDRWCFHPEHFKCAVCETTLGANTAVVIEGVLKCRECASGQRDMCSGCGESVRLEWLSACGKKWHRHCFKCQFCKGALANKQFVDVDSAPACVQCYERMKAEGKLDRRHRVKC